MKPALVSKVQRQGYGQREVLGRVLFDRQDMNGFTLSELFALTAAKA